MSNSYSGGSEAMIVLGPSYQAEISFLFLNHTFLWYLILVIKVIISSLLSILCEFQK